MDKIMIVKKFIKISSINIREVDCNKIIDNKMALNSNITISSY